MSYTENELPQPQVALALGFLTLNCAPLRSSTSEIINLASIAAYSADVIDYKK